MSDVMSRSVMAELHSVSVDVPGRPGLLRDVDFSVRCGDRLAVMGPSGSGKSTFIAVVGRLLRPAVGSVVHHRLQPFQILLISQQTLVLPYQSVLHNVAISGLPFGYSWQQSCRRAEEACRAVGLGGVARSRAGEVSGGERQRLGVARALVGEYRLILADEPTASLDAELVVQVSKVLVRRTPE